MKITLMIKNGKIEEVEGEGLTKSMIKILEKMLNDEIQVEVLQKLDNND